MASGTRTRSRRKSALVDHRWFLYDLREDYSDAVANEETDLTFEDWVVHECPLTRSATSARPPTVHVLLFNPCNDEDEDGLFVTGVYSTAAKARTAAFPNGARAPWFHGVGGMLGISRGNAYFEIQKHTVQ